MRHQSKPVWAFGSLCRLLGAFTYVLHFPCALHRVGKLRPQRTLHFVLGIKALGICETLRFAQNPLTIGAGRRVWSGCEERVNCKRCFTVEASPTKRDQVVFRHGSPRPGPGGRQEVSSVWVQWLVAKGRISFVRVIL